MLICRNLLEETVNCPKRSLIEGGKSFTEGVEGSLGSISQVKLIENVADVSAHGPLADKERITDLLIRNTLGDQPQNFNFARRQRFGGCG